MIAQAALLALPATVLIATGDAQSATRTWTGGNGNNNFATSSNWNSSGPGSTSSTTNTDVAYIQAGGAQITGGTMDEAGSSNPAHFYVGTIWYDQAASGNTDVSLNFTNNQTNGSTLQLNSASITIGGNPVANVILADTTTSATTFSFSNKSGSGALTLALGNSTNNVIYAASGDTVDLETAVTGANTPLTFVGAAGNSTLVLGGTNTFTGGTTVSSGTLMISGGVIGTFSPTSSGSVTVAGGTLASKTAGGYVQGNVILSSATNAIAAGAGASGTGTGNLTIGGNLSFTNGGSDTLSFNVNGNLSSQLDVLGTINFNSVVPTISINSGTPTVGDSYNLLEFVTANDPSLTTGNLSSYFSTPTIANFKWAVVSLGGGNSAVELEANTGPAITWNPTGGANAATGTWNSSLANWIPTGGGNQTTYADTDVLTFGDLGAGIAGNVSIPGNVAPAIVTFTNTSAGTTFNLSGAGAITGTTGVNLNGNGTVILSNSSNTYSGTTTISGGILQAGAANAFSANSPVVLSSTQSALLDLNGGNQTIGGLSGGGASGNVALGGATLTINGSGSQTFAGAINDAGGNVSGATTGALVVNGPTITLTATSSYGGSTTINSGELILGNGTNLLPTTTALIINGGEFQVTGAGNSQAVAELDGNSTAGHLSVASSASLTIGSDNASTTFAGYITGSGNLTKVGTGSLTFSGTNSYSGTTIISAGTLVAADTSSTAGQSSTGTKAVLLAPASGTATLASASGVTSYISGSVTTSGAGTSTIAPGGTSGIGTLHVGGNLTLAANSALDFEINGSSGDLLAITGTLAASGSPAIDFSSSGTLAGKYVLATYANSSISSSSFATLPTAPSGYSWNVTNTDIELDPSQLTWNGTLNGADVSGSWDTLSDTPWKDQNSNPASFAPGEPVTFADIGGATTGTITIDAGGVAPSSVTVNNTNTTYTFTGGAIGSAYGASLLKEGSGTLIVNNTNSYTGGTVISGGTVQLGTNNALPTGGNVAIANVSGAKLDLAGNNQTITELSGGGSSGGNVILGGGALTVGDSVSTTFGGVISDSGGAAGNVTDAAGVPSLVKTGSGTLTLGASETYTGQTVISGGLLSLAPLSAGTVAVLPSTTSLVFPTSNTMTAEFQVNGQSQTIAELSGGTVTSGQVSINAAGETPVLTVGDANTTTFGGKITGSGSLTKVNSGTLVLNGGTDTYSGATVVSGGTLRVNTLLNATPTITVNSGATFGGNGTIGAAASAVGAITVNSGGTINAGSDSVTPGILTSLSTSGLTLAGGSKINWTWTDGGNIAGSDWGQITTQGNATQGMTLGTLASPLSSGSPLTVAISGSPTNLTAGNASYPIITDPTGNISINGSPVANNTVLTGNVTIDTSGFSTVNSPSITGSSFELEVVADSSGTGQDLDLVYNGDGTVAAPEPCTSLLVLGGTAPMLIARRRRRVSTLHKA